MKLNEYAVKEFKRSFELALGLRSGAGRNTVARIEFSKHPPFSPYATFGTMDYYRGSEIGKLSLQASTVFVEIGDDQHLYWYRGFEYRNVLFEGNKDYDHHDAGQVYPE